MESRVDLVGLATFLLAACALPGVFSSHLPNYPQMEECTTLKGRTLRVGVVHDNQVVYLNATFGEYLSRFLARSGCDGGSEMVVQSHTVLFPAVADAVANPQAPELDFVFTDPGTLTVLQRFHPGKLKLLSTILRVQNGAIMHQLGGVLVRRADSVRASGLSEWADLADPTLPANNLSLCAIERDSFAGWQIQDLECIFQADRRLENLFQLNWLKHESDIYESNDEVLDAVNDGTCDVGLVVTGTMERLASSPSLYSGLTIPLDTWKVVGAMSVSADFPLASSTRLYPEWGLLALSHVPPRIAEIVKIALEALWDQDPVAVAGKHAGFLYPSDYTEAAVVEFHLDEDGDGTCAPGWQRQQTGGNRICTKCEAGYYSATGIGVCLPCLPGEYQDLEASTGCKKCPEGYSTFQDGASECVINENISFQPIQACSNYKNNTLVIAVMQEEAGQEHMWKPTFDTTVNAFMNRYNCFVKMAMLPFEQLHQAVRDKEIDFIFLDGGEYSQLHYEYGIEALAMVLRNYQGFTTAHEGGVIFRNSSAERTAGVTTIHDIVRVGKAIDLTVCLTHSDSFTGWAVQEYEFFKLGYDIHVLFKRIVVSGSHEATVTMVMDGSCDIGMVPTYTIEKLDHLDYKPSDFSIINQQYYDHFALQISTPLYSQWPFAALKHVEEEIASQIVLPLLCILEGDDAAVQGKIGGFIRATSYQNESEVNFHLNLMDPETNVCFPGSTRDFKSALQPCELCPPGHYNTDGFECHLCSPDFYTDKPGMTACLPCGDGFINYEFGSTSCRKEEDVLIYQPIQACAQFKDKTLVVGVLAEVSLEKTIQQWKPTFEDALNDYFNRYQCWFRMEALHWHVVDKAVRNKDIDFLFADSGLYMKYEHSVNMTALASVLSIFDGHMTPWYGGVMVRNATQHTDIFELEDLKKASVRNLTACPVDEEDIGGWNAQQYEFFKAGIALESVFTHVFFTHSHKESVELMRRGLCDVAMVRTKTLEQFVHAEVFEMADVVIINRRHHDNFIEVVSTDLYPEWPFAALSHVPRQLSSVVSTPLLAMREYHRAAVEGSHAGFSSSLSYQSVSELRYQLAMEPDASCGPGAFRQLDQPLQPCALCAPGSVSFNGIGGCTKCPAGSISPGAGGNTCQTCKFGYYTAGTGQTECVERHDTMELSYSAQVVVWACAAVAVAFCLLICALVLKHRKTKLIKASSFVFNVILILASMMVCASTILFSVLPQPDNVVCSLRWWLPCLAASTVFGTLFSKTYRLYTIFRIYEIRQKIPSAIKFKDTRVAWMVLCFQAVTALVLLIFFLVDPPLYYLDKIAVEGQAFDTYVHSCRVSHVFVPLIFILYVLLLTAQSWLAFRVRKLPTVFNESQLIAWLLYNTVFVGLVAIMVDALLDTMQGTALMMVRSVALFLGALTTVFVLYVPKLHVIYRNGMNDSKFSSKESGRTKGTGNTTNDIDTHAVGPSALASNVAVGPSKHVSHQSHANDSDVHAQKRNKQLGKNSQVSALSGLSDDGNEQLDDFRFDLVPSSDIAGEETFQIAADEYRLHIDLSNASNRAQDNLNTLALPEVDDDRDSEAMRSKTAPTVLRMRKSSTEMPDMQRKSRNSPKAVTGELLPVSSGSSNSPQIATRELISRQNSNSQNRAATTTREPTTPTTKESVKICEPTTPTTPNQIRQTSEPGTPKGGRWQSSDPMAPKESPVSLNKKSKRASMIQEGEGYDAEVV